jgi:methyl coenzyme M reductase beta subunit
VSDSQAVPVLSETDVAVLVAAEHVLKAIVDRAERASWNESGSRAANLGRLAERATVTADAVFDVLNCAASRLRDPLSERELEERFRVDDAELAEVDS